MLKKHLLMGSVVSGLALTLALAGCGGSAGGGTTDTSSSTEAAEEEAAEEEREADSVGDTEEEAEVEPEVEEEAPADEAVEAHLNEPISTENYDIEFVEGYWDAADEEGSWRYYDGGSISYSMRLAENAQVFVVRATITSKATAAIKPSLYCRGTALINDKYEYEVKATSATGGSSDITPLETADVLLYVEVPQAMKDQFEDIDIKWGFTTGDSYPQSFEDLDEVYDLYFK